MEKRPYEKLIVWQEAHALCLKMYQITKSFPKDELFALTSQMRRAAYSVPMNIVEGNSRSTRKDYVHFLTIARASLEELHYQLTLVGDLGYLAPSIVTELHNWIRRVSFLLQKLRTSLQ